MKKSNENKKKVIRDMTPWQIAIVVLILLAAAASITLVVLNWGSDESIEMLKPILGGFFVALFFALIALASPIENFKSKTIVGILVNNKEAVIPFSAQSIDKSFTDGYSEINQLLYSPHKDLIKQKQGHQYLLELFEVTFFSWLSENFPRHWQIEREWLVGLSGGSSLKKIKPGADMLDIKRTYTKDVMSGNMYSQVHSFPVYFPKYKTLEYRDHSINLETSNIIATINFGRTGFMSQIDSTDLGKKLVGTHGPKIYQQVFQIDFFAKPKQWRRWSKKTQEQMAWFKEVAQMYEQSFSFERQKWGE